MKTVAIFTLVALGALGLLRVVIGDMMERAVITNDSEYAVQYWS